MQPLEEEAIALRLLHARIAEQLHRLQVEEVALQRQVDAYRRNGDYLSARATSVDFNGFNPDHLSLMSFEAVSLTQSTAPSLPSSNTEM